MGRHVFARPVVALKETGQTEPVVGSVEEERGAAIRNLKKLGDCDDALWANRERGFDPFGNWRICLQDDLSAHSQDGHK